MSTITKEFTKEQLQQIIETDHVQCGEASALARIALASLGAEKIAEPVAKVETVGVCWYADNGVPRKPAVGTELYTAPPATVSVPLAIHDEDFEKALSVLNDTLDDCGDSERGLLLALDKAGIEVRSDACRAAMLQGGKS